MFTVVVVFPTPPFWLAMVITRVTWATLDRFFYQFHLLSRLMFPVKHLPANQGLMVFWWDQVAVAPGYCVLFTEAPVRRARTTVVSGSTTPAPHVNTEISVIPYWLIAWVAASISV